MKTQQSEEQQQQIIKGQHNYDPSIQQYRKVAYLREEFPKWKYHTRDGRAQLVKDRADQEALGSDWQDARPAPTNPAKSENDLRQENEDLKKQLAALKKEQGKQGLILIGADNWGPGVN